MGKFWQAYERKRTIHIIIQIISNVQLQEMIFKLFNNFSTDKRTFWDYIS